MVLGMGASPLDLKGDGDEMATSPFSPKGNGDGHLSILAEGEW